MGEREWYFFSLRDRKYPTGLRTNRATGAGYWKATGKDREVYSSSNSSNGGAGSASKGGQLLGMKKTLVFYKGRAPRGEKTKWVMHEYRLDGEFSFRHTCKEEWVICRIFHKMGEKKIGVVLQGQSSSHYMQEASITSSSPSKTGLLELQPHKPIQSLQNQNQNPFLINDHHHENDLKSLIPVNNNSSSAGDAAVSQAFPIHPINGGYQTSFSPRRTNKEKEDTTDKQSPSSFFRPHLSNQQDYYYYYNCPTSFEEHQTAPPTSTIIIPKHCKTEPNFSHFDQFTSNDHNNAAILRCPMPPDYSNNYKIQQQNPTSGGCYQSPFLFGTMDTIGGFPSAAAGADANLHEMSTSSSSTSGVLAFNRAGFHQLLLDSSIKLAVGESWPFNF